MDKLTQGDLRVIFSEARLNPNHRGGGGTVPRRGAKRLPQAAGFTIRDPDSRKNRKRRRLAAQAGPTTEQRRRHTLGLVAQTALPLQPVEAVA